MMREKAKAAVARLTDPEQARQEWEDLELQAMAGYGQTRIPIEELLAGILAA